MRQKLFSLMFVLTLSVAMMAQTSLKGRVVDDNTGQPVVGARVTLANQNISTTTNSAGEFSTLPRGHGRRNGGRGRQLRSCARVDQSQTE